MAAIDYLKNFLRNEGFRFEESESFLNFKVQGNTYYAFKSDSPYLQIVIICNYGCTRSRALEICNQLNSDKYITKCVVNDDRVWCSWEFLPTEHTTTDYFMTIFQLLDHVSDEFLAKSNE